MEANNLISVIGLAYIGYLLNNLLTFDLFGFMVAVKCIEFNTA